MKPSLNTSQKDKLADFFITVAAGWFIATIITPFFTLTSFPAYNIIVGIINLFLYLWLAVVIIKINYE